jgi:large exoprotein involved in heme utilization and adhesion
LSVDAQDVQVIGTTANGQIPSILSASTQPNSTGDAGDLTIKTKTLLVRDGAQVATGTLGAGKGENLRIEAQDVQVIGTSVDPRLVSGLFASTGRNSTGDAGDLTIETNTLLVRDGAIVTVQSLGTGTAGNMTLNASSIRLDNDAFISANTRSALVDPNREQATININSQDLILTRNSNIRTNATGDNVFGGNIRINTDNLVAVPKENSDISANSANFRGGNVTIRAIGIFGIEFREQLTPLSDITATGFSEEFSGTVNIITPGIDPARGLAQLPTEVVDASDEIAQGCRDVQGSSFVVTGRGGCHLPLNKPWAMTHVGETGALRLELAVSRTFLGREPYRLQLTQPVLNQHGWKRLGGRPYLMVRSSSQQVRLMPPPPIGGDSQLIAMGRRS